MWQKGAAAHNAVGEPVLLGPTGLQDSQALQGLPKAASLEAEGKWDIGQEGAVGEACFLIHSCACDLVGRVRVPAPKSKARQQSPLVSWGDLMGSKDPWMVSLTPDCCRLRTVGRPGAQAAQELKRRQCSKGIGEKGASLYSHDVHLRGFPKEQKSIGKDP